MTKRIFGIALVVIGLLMGCGGEKPAVKAVEKTTPGRTLGRVMVIGFDGLEPTTVARLVGEHKLPNFTRLMHEGAFGGLMSTLPPSSASAWTSSCTGVNPGKHNIYGFMGQSKPDAAGHVVFSTSLQRGYEAVWQVLGKYGKRSVVINIPLTSPADSLNGLMIAGFPHATEDTSSYFWPHSLRNELADYAFDSFRVAVAKNREDRFIQKMKGIESKRLEVGLRLMDREQWDLFWIAFIFTDRYQHYLWKYTDKSHPMYDAIGGGEYGGAIESAYVMADDYLGEFMKRMKDNDLMIVMSDHGFRRLDYIVNAQNFLYRVLGGTKDVACDDFFGTKFKINVSGPDAEERYAGIRDRLIDGLKALKDPANGASIIDSVYVKDQIYKGAYLSRAPDVIAMENPDYLFFTLSRTPDLRVIDAGSNPSMAFSGFHRRRGSIGLLGNRVLPGKAPEAKVEDVTAIILAYLGVPAPSEIDGRVPTDVFKTEPGAEVRLVKSRESGYLKPAGSTGQDANALEKQLKAVGYIQ